ncbi:single-stranded DNA-binding protein [Saccharothrix violaceirubra]
MAYNETRVTLVGKVSSVVTHTTADTGLSRASFRMYSRERRYNRETEVWEDGRQLFLNVTCWRKLADNVHMSLNKGDPVVVTGVLRIADRDLDGIARQFVDIDAHSVGPDLTWCTAEVRAQRHRSGADLPRTEADVPRSDPASAAAVDRASPPEADAEVPF